jgi:hypothetical protein
MDPMTHEDTGTDPLKHHIQEHHCENLKSHYEGSRQHLKS